MLPNEEKFGLKSQICRAAVSIPSNIAEGSSRNSEIDFKRYLEIALGSAFELETQLIIIQELHLAPEEKLLNLKVSEENNELYLTTQKGDVCIPEIIRTVGETVLSVRLQRPTLNDVFLKMTGKAIRDENSSSTENVKQIVRSYRRKFERN